MSIIVALANKFSKLVLIFEQSAAVADDDNAEALREGSLERMASLAIDITTETPANEEDALHMLSVINHHLIVNKIDPVAAKQARANARALITSELAIDEHMEMETEQLLQITENELPNKETLKARLIDVLEEIARLKKNDSQH